MNLHLSSSESAVRALLVCGDPPTIEQLSKSLQELAASTEVCTDIPNAIRLVNTRKFETVVVDLKLGEQSRSVLERVRLSPSNHTTVAFAITRSANESAYQLSPPKLRTGGDGALDNALYFLNLLEVMSRQKTKAAAA